MAGTSCSRKYTYKRAVVEEKRSVKGGMVALAIVVLLAALLAVAVPAVGAQGVIYFTDDGGALVIHSGETAVNNTPASKMVCYLMDSHTYGVAVVNGVRFYTYIAPATINAMTFDFPQGSILYLDGVSGSCHLERSSVYVDSNAVVSVTPIVTTTTAGVSTAGTVLGK